VVEMDHIRAGRSSLGTGDDYSARVDAMFGSASLLAGGVKPGTVA
jgi:hypothetical protein